MYVNISAAVLTLINIEPLCARPCTRHQAYSNDHNDLSLT